MKNFLLVHTEHHLEIRHTTKNYNPIYIDFLHGKKGYRAAHGGGFKQQLARACGVRPKQLPFILDATAGFGSDAFALACLGCHITLLERSTIVAALLRDGMQRASHALPEIMQRMKFIEIDAIDFLRREGKFDVIYLDPMYPHSNKSSLVKKEMRILRDIVGEDSDINILFALAKKAARLRVVVKRPQYAPTIDNTKPDIQFKGSSTRFDVYLSTSHHPDNYVLTSNDVITNR